MAESIFEHLAQGPTDLVDADGNEWDYSIDGFNVDEYRPAK